MIFKTKYDAPTATLAAPAKAPQASLPPPASSRAASKAADVPTIVSPDMVIEGNLKTTGDVQVEGVMTGQLEAGRIVIAEGGAVKGDVTAETVRVCGTITGSVHGGTVTLTTTARVLGDVWHDLLTVETGGLLEGYSRRRAVAKPEAVPVAGEVRTTPPRSRIAELRTETSDMPDVAFV